MSKLWIFTPNFQFFAPAAPIGTIVEYFDSRIFCCLMEFIMVEFVPVYFIPSKLLVICPPPLRFSGYATDSFCLNSCISYSCIWGTITAVMDQNLFVALCLPDVCWTYSVIGCLQSSDILLPNNALWQFLLSKLVHYFIVLFMSKHTSS